MKKKENAQGLSNIFNEFEKIDLTGKALDDELTELGFDPKDLARKVRERIDKIKTGHYVVGMPQADLTKEFDPLLLAAAKRKGKRPSKGGRKKD